MAKKNIEIEQPNLILCEGVDAAIFINHYLDKLENNGEKEFEEFQGMDFRGNEDLPSFLKVLPNLDNYSTVKSITIIRDAEKDHKAAVQSVRSALSKYGFPVPTDINEIAQDEKIKVAFSLFPTLSKIAEDGTLEDLYMKNLVNSPKGLISNIDDFLKSLQEKGFKITRFHKSRLYTYFAVTDKFTSLKLAEAANAGAFQFDCDEMNCLKNLLKEMCI